MFDFCPHSINPHTKFFCLKFQKKVPFWLMKVSNASRPIFSGIMSSDTLNLAKNPLFLTNVGVLINNKINNSECIYCVIFSLTYKIWCIYNPYPIILSCEIFLLPEAQSGKSRRKYEHIRIGHLITDSLLLSASKNLTRIIKYLIVLDNAIKPQPF